MSVTEKQTNRKTEGEVKAALYCRVSTAQQVDKDSLSTQESRLRAYCVANGLRIFKVYKDEGVSAKDTDRPELRSLMEACRQGSVQAVVVTALDRITRSLRDLHRLVDFFDENNIRFISITQNIDSSSAFGRFMRDLIGNIAELERGMVAERVANDMHHRALLGKWNGGMVPYGYTTQQRLLKAYVAEKVPEERAKKKAMSICPEPKRLYIDAGESVIVRNIFETFIESRSLRRTAHTLNSIGIKSRSGRTWAVSTIHKILTSPVCTGKISYGKTRTDIETGKLKNVQKEEWKVVKGQHEPIVSENVFQEAQNILKSGSRKPTRASHSYLLSGLLRCGKCGGAMHGATFEKQANKKTYSYYKCVNHETKGNSVCTGLSRSAKQLDDFVVRTLTQLSEDRGFLQDREEMLSAMKDEIKPSGRKSTLEKLKKDERTIQAKIENLMEGWESGLFEKQDFAREYGKLKAQLRENRLEQEKLSDSVDLWGAAYKALNASLEQITSFGRNWEYLDDASRAARISLIVKKITVPEDNNLCFQLFLDVKEVSSKVSHHRNRPDNSSLS